LILWIVLIPPECEGRWLSTNPAIKTHYWIQTHGWAPGLTVVPGQKN